MIRLTYFKPTGKYYAEGKLQPLRGETFWDLIARVRELHGSRRLPGLAPGHSDFIVLVETPDGLGLHGTPHIITS